MKSEELKRSIELEIQKYEQKLNVTSIGYVLQSGDGIGPEVIGEVKKLLIGLMIINL